MTHQAHVAALNALQLSIRMQANQLARRNNNLAISNTLTPFPQLEGGWLPPYMRNEKHVVTQTPIE